ncbi:MAG: tRNA lysidine(34) synthetase TilS [Bacteroidetes bacterium]|nr:tRNA lysidine(34) synthetase TilS [Bacteroidota bacterium]
MNSDTFIKFIENQNLFLPQEHILLAVSGGIDSTVMAHLFHQAKFRFGIAHCNFSLRGKESDDDAEFVKKLAFRLKAPYFSVRFDTSEIALQRGISIQMAARDLRYEWFERTRQENRYDYIATAHHLDDQVETFLINLIRGTGIAGMHGIPVKNGKIIRPLLFAFRKDIDQYAGKHKIGYRTDQSNNEAKYLRNNIRHHLVPLLCSINPEFSQGLSGTIKRLSAFEQIGNLALENWCKSALVKDGRDIIFDAGCLLQVDPVESYAWALLSPFGFNETQVSNLLDCLVPGKRKTFHSSSHSMVLERGRIVVSPVEEKIQLKPSKIGLFAHKKKIRKPLPLLFERNREVGGYEIPATGTIASLDFDKLQFPLILRTWQTGDAFFPLGMKKKKKLSDFFIDQKFSVKDKEQTWLLCSGKHIVWILGHRIDHRYRVTSATREVLCIKMLVKEALRKGYPDVTI